LIQVVEGMAPGPVRLWDELPAVAGAHRISVSAATVLPPGGHGAQWDAIDCEWCWLGARSSRGYPLAAARLAALSHRRRADVVQGTGPIAGFVTALAGRLGARGLTVFHRQGEEFEHHPAMARLSWMAGRLAPMTLACSQSTARYAHERDDVPWRKLRVAHNAANRMRPVAASELAGLRRRLGIDPAAAVIAVVAKLRPEKNILTLLDALPQIAAAIERPLALVVAGDGVEAGALRAAVPATPNVKVWFAGHQDDVALWFSLGDVVAMPSRREPFGVAAVEAMMCGRPLVAGRVGGLTEVIEDGRSGLLINPDDAAQLATSIVRVLRDSELAARLGAAGRERALAHFTNEAMVAAWRAAWQSQL
jgi:glycosyltransferase involved in cell wall biosynthesis